MAAEASEIVDVSVEKIWKPPPGVVALICRTEVINKRASLKPVLKDHDAADVYENELFNEQDANLKLEDNETFANDSGIAEDTGNSFPMVPVAPPLPLTICLTEKLPPVAPLFQLSSDELSKGKNNLKKNTNAEEDEGFEEPPKEGMEAVNEELQKKIQETAKRSKPTDWVQKFEKGPKQKGKFQAQIQDPKLQELIKRQQEKLQNGDLAEFENKFLKPLRNTEDEDNGDKNNPNDFTKFQSIRSLRKCNKQISEEIRTAEELIPGEIGCTPRGTDECPITQIDKKLLSRSFSTPNTTTTEDPCLNPFKQFGVTPKREKSISEEENHVNIDNTSIRPSMPPKTATPLEDPSHDPFKQFGLQKKRFSVRISNSDMKSLAEDSAATASNDLKKVLALRKAVNSTATTNGVHNDKVKAIHLSKPVILGKPTGEPTQKQPSAEPFINTLNSLITNKNNKDKETPKTIVEEQHQQSDAKTATPPPIPCKPNKITKVTDTSMGFCHKETIQNAESNNECYEDLPPPPSPTEIEQDIHKYVEEEDLETLALPPPPLPEDCWDESKDLTMTNMPYGNIENVSSKEVNPPPLPPTLPPIDDTPIPRPEMVSNKTQEQAKMDAKLSLLAQIRENNRKNLKPVVIPNEPKPPQLHEKTSSHLHGALRKMRSFIKDESDTSESEVDNSDDDDKWN